jgi:hypothetical protein
MRSSSARQLEFDYSGSQDLLPAPPGVVDVVGASAPLRVPNFGVSNQVYAATARIAGRLNAANVSPNEHKSLLDERQALLDKKLGGTITRREENRLAYVRWSLDRIEDAKYGQSLDVLEDWVQRYEQFLADMRNFEIQLVQQTQRSRKGGNDRQR